MDGFFGKFGLYDFMGVWGPGAIVLTYCYFTFYDMMKACVEGLDIAFPVFDQKYYFALLYTAVAYVLGVIIHEVGELASDVLFPYIESKLSTCSKKGVQDASNTDSDNTSVGQYIEEDKANAAAGRTVTVRNRGICFEDARSYLRFSNGIDMRRIDTYHSVYAFSRSLCVGITVHLVLAVYFAENNELLKTLVLIDCVLLLLFVIRTCRYRGYWEKYTLVQYELVTQENPAEKGQAYEVRVNRV